MADAGVVTAADEDAARAWRRLVGHVLRSYAAPDAELRALPSAPSPGDLTAAMVRHGSSSPLPR